MTQAMPIEIRILDSDQRDVLARIEPGVFDRAIDHACCAEFLADQRHHLVVAIDAGVVVAMASAVHYVHPDKQPQMWINEVGVTPSHRQRGLATQLLQALLKLGRDLGCSEAWVLTERQNAPAMRLYASCGPTEAPRDQVMFTFNLR